MRVEPRRDWPFILAPDGFNACRGCMGAKYSAIVSGEQNNSIFGDFRYLLSRIQSIHPGHGEIIGDHLKPLLPGYFEWSREEAQ